MGAGAGEPVARVCLLGASNLTRGFPAAVRAARDRLGGPLEVFAALGRGRSFVGTSSFFGRRLPGIAQCGLWPALAAAGEEHALPSFGLICDMGNDVAYGASAAIVMRELERTAERLEQVGARCVVLGPPLDSVRAISATSFRLWGRVFFPDRGLDRTRVIATLEEVDEGLRQLCAARALAFVEPQPDWYGLDPIHVRHQAQQRAWRAILASWGAGDGPPLGGRIPLPAPLERELFGVSLRREQPGARLADGTTLAIY